MKAHSSKNKVYIKVRTVKVQKTALARNSIVFLWFVQRLLFKASRRSPCFACILGWQMNYNMQRSRRAFLGACSSLYIGIPDSLFTRTKRWWRTLCVLFYPRAFYTRNYVVAAAVLPRLSLTNSRNRIPRRFDVNVHMHDCNSETTSTYEYQLN